MTDAPDPRPLLTTRGHVYVTLAAAQQYAAGLLRADGQSLQIESARRELTERLLVARVQPDGEAFAGDNLHARARSRTWGIDIDVRCTIEGPLVVVVATNVRRR